MTSGDVVDLGAMTDSARLTLLWISNCSIPAMFHHSPIQATGIPNWIGR